MTRFHFDNQYFAVQCNKILIFTTSHRIRKVAVIVSFISRGVWLKTRNFRICVHNCRERMWGKSKNIETQLLYRRWEKLSSDEYVASLSSVSVSSGWLLTSVGVRKVCLCQQERKRKVKCKTLLTTNQCGTLSPQIFWHLLPSTLSHTSHSTFCPLCGRI